MEVWYLLESFDLNFNYIGIYQFTDCIEKPKIACPVYDIQVVIKY